MRTSATVFFGLSLCLSAACGEPRVPVAIMVKPAAPTSLTARHKVGSKDIMLYWEDNSQNESGFGIERKIGGAFKLVGKTAKNTPGFKDTVAADQTKLEYRVYAYNGAGRSAYSEVLVLSSFVTVSELQIPEAPTDLSVVIAASTQMQITWSDNSVTETGFKIERKGLTGTYSQLALTSADTQSYLDTTAAPGSAYTYRLAAYNDMGDSAYSNEAAVGCFDMGDTTAFFSNAVPVHSVCLNSFVTDPYEVSNAQFQACVTAGQCAAPADVASSMQVTYYTAATYASFPVVHVDRSQAIAYCQWAGKRLPTEAEWEIAARGGLAGKIYPHGDSIGCTDVNYRFSGGSPCMGDTTDAGSYAANGYGLFDMAGNVWEWVADWYDEAYYATSPANDPRGPASGSVGIIKGGSWNVGEVANRLAIRYATAITTTGNDIGFRCVR